MSSVEERNNSGQYYVNTRLGVAKTKTKEDFPEFDESSEVYKLLGELIEVNAKGFRGVVVTAITGLHLDESYDPVNNFYDCNPRRLSDLALLHAQRNESSQYFDAYHRVFALCSPSILQSKRYLAPSLAIQRMHSLQVPSNAYQ